MHIHKPKAPHGLGEFVREIGVIVCGVLIAIALEQAVEALHRRAQAREMLEKLHEEGVENRHVLDHDIKICSGRIAWAARSISAVSAAVQANKIPAAPDPPPDSQPVLPPADAAWITIRDSGLLPIMPKLTVDNYWKLDALGAVVTKMGEEAEMNGRRVTALIHAAHQRPMDAGLAHDLLLSLDEYQVSEWNRCEVVRAFRGTNEVALAGKRIDIDPSAVSSALASPPPSP
jgi:hypothetical protein